MTENRRMLIFGGSFDPPHLGHMNFLQMAITAVKPGRVTVVPAGIPPHKTRCRAAPALRLAMCRCFMPLFPGLVISEAELWRGDKSYTIDTVKALRQEYPDAEFYLCIGGDMLAGFTAWRSWREIVQAAVLVAAERGDGTDIEKAAEGLRRAGGRVMLVPGLVMPISSAAVRTALAANDKSVFDYIPAPADKIIRENRLYETNNDS